MTAPCGGAPLAPVWHSAAWMAALTGILLTLAGGALGLGAARPLFLAASAAAGYLAWREGPARTAEIALLLFTAAPFLRRIVDLRLGFEPAGLMLLGPLLPMLFPIIGLRTLLTSRRPQDGMLGPFVLILLCMAYGTLAAILSGNLGAAMPIIVKSLIPLLYGMWLLREMGDPDDLMRHLRRAFLLTAPVAGLYGVFQYVNPPEWDRYWMFSTKAFAFGLPEPYLIRVFSTMHSPGSYGVYAVAALLLLCFYQPSWRTTLLCLPVILALMLSLYRTAWISLVLGVGFCFLFYQTRPRALMLTGLVAAATLVVVSSNSEFSDAIIDRLMTLGNSVQNDGSGAERFQQFASIYDRLEELLFGLGYGFDARWDGMLYADGEIAVSVITLGIVVAPLYLLGLVWAILQAVGGAGWRSSSARVVSGAITVGAIVQIPLAIVTSGELGFLFWTFVAVSTACRFEPADRPVSGLVISIARPSFGHPLGPQGRTHRAGGIP